MSADTENGHFITTSHLVKGEDLNHHQTLYGGRCVEWCVQMAFITAQNCFDDNRPVVFMSVRNLSMRNPARLGDIVTMAGRVDYIGASTIGIRVDVRNLHPKGDPKTVATGTFLFCTVDEMGKSISHGLPEIETVSASATARWKKAVDALETSTL